MIKRKTQIFIGLTAVFTCLIAIIFVDAAAAIDIKSDEKEIKIKTFIPEELPVTINRITVTETGGESRLKFFVTNNTRMTFEEIHFTVFVVNENGRVKAGQGWKAEKKIDGLASTEIQKNLKHSPQLNDQLILTSYKVSGKSKGFEVAPLQIVERLEERNLIIR